ELECRSAGGLTQSAGRRLILQTANGCDKPVPGLWDRFDVFVVARLFLERLPQRRDIPIEVARFNETIRPNELHELFLGHHLSSLLEQHEEDSEHSRGDGHALTALGQKELAAVDAKVVEFVNDSFCAHAPQRAIVWPNRTAFASAVRNVALNRRLVFR